MSSAAGRQVEIADLDEAQRPLADWLLAKRQPRGFACRYEAHRDLAIFPDDVIRFVNGSFELVRCRFARQVDRGHLGAHVKAGGSILEEPIECGRQHMLTRVLLHVIEPANPVDLASYTCTRRDRRTHHVNDVIVLIDGLDNVDRPETTGVEGLPAGCGIERRAIECDERAPVTLADARHRRLERTARRLGVVDALGHRRKAGSRRPASANPLARSTQLSQRPHGPPSGRDRSSCASGA